MYYCSSLLPQREQVNQHLCFQLLGLKYLCTYCNPDHQSIHSLIFKIPAESISRIWWVELFSEWGFCFNCATLLMTQSLIVTLVYSTQRKQKLHSSRKKPKHNHHTLHQKESMFTGAVTLITQSNNLKVSPCVQLAPDPLSVHTSW